MEYQAPEVLGGENNMDIQQIYTSGNGNVLALNNQTLPRRDENCSRLAMEAAKRNCTKACESRPEDRYASAQEFYDALSALKNKRIMTMFGVIWSTLAGIAYGVGAIFGDEIGSVILFAILAFSELYSVYYNFFTRKRKVCKHGSKRFDVPKLFADFLLCAMPFILVMVSLIWTWKA